MTWTSPLALWPFRRSPAPTTCAEAGRTGVLVKAERGWSSGMSAARSTYEREGFPFEIRTIGEAPA